MEAGGVLADLGDEGRCPQYVAQLANHQRFQLLSRKSGKAGCSGVFLELARTDVVAIKTSVLLARLPRLQSPAIRIKEQSLQQERDLGASFVAAPFRLDSDN